MNEHVKPLPDFVEERLDFYIQDLLEQNQNNQHLVLGQQPQVSDVVLQSNDYLALTNNLEIQAAHREALLDSEDQVVMSAIFMQDACRKPKFEQQLAQHVGMESGLLSQSGWAANIALLQTICAPNTPVYIDFFAHMSLWEGARAAGAQRHAFMHNNLKHLRRQLERYKAGVIVVDSVYSTIGTVAPLEALCDLAQEFNCALVVDESHSLGTHGPCGEGLVKQLGLSHRVDFITVSLAKAFAYRAGAILGHHKIAKTLPFVAYPAIFSSALLPAEISRLEKTLEVIKASNSARKQLTKNSQAIIEGLKEIGFRIRSESQIIALECGSERNTEKVRDFLEQRGVFGAVFCRPATGRNNNIIRFSVHADLKPEQIEHLLNACHAAFHHPDLEFN